jgi:hypothetical protein
MSNVTLRGPGVGDDDPFAEDGPLLATLLPGGANPTPEPGWPRSPAALSAVRLCYE